MSSEFEFCENKNIFRCGPEMEDKLSEFTSKIRLFTSHTRMHTQTYTEQSIQAHMRTFMPGIVQDNYNITLSIDVSQHHSQGHDTVSAVF